jgi:hypothetical protein
MSKTLGNYLDKELSIDIDVEEFINKAIQDTRDTVNEIKHKDGERFTLDHVNLDGNAAEVSITIDSDFCNWVNPKETTEGKWNPHSQLKND